MITFFRRHAATLAVILTVAGFATPAVVVGAGCTEGRR